MVLLEGRAAAVAAIRRSPVPSTVRLGQQLRKARKRSDGEYRLLVEYVILNDPSSGHDPGFFDVIDRGEIPVHERPFRRRRRLP